MKGLNTSMYSHVYKLVRLSCCNHLHRVHTFSNSPKLDFLSPYLLAAIVKQSGSYLLANYDSIWTRNHRKERAQAPKYVIRKRLSLQVETSRYIKISSWLSLPDICMIACCISGDTFFPCPMPAMHCEPVNSGARNTDRLQIPISKTSSYGNRTMLGSFSGLIQVEWYTFRQIPAVCWGDTNNWSLVFLFRKICHVAKLPEIDSN